ncbi:MAG: SBBP repeat-containing protein, partial [Candidatus Brocadia sinica]|nr:SBBP repeat-containing protein [Candidatus Brocadia sinica]
MNFPTASAYQGSNAGGDDAFVTKISVSGGALVYSTYLGGSGNDLGIGIAVDSLGNAYVTGYTQSTDFPTASAYQGSNAGTFDAFVTKISASGDNLIYSTYLGGGGNDYGFGMVVDGSGNAYVMGRTDSTDFPTTVSAYQDTNAGSLDAFVTKIRLNATPTANAGTDQTVDELTMVTLDGSGSNDADGDPLT